MRRTSPPIDVERFEQSKDRRLRRFLETATGFFSTRGLEYAAFGSCAVFAHRGRVHRLTRDLDVVVPAESFERLPELARAHGFEADRERDHFVRIRSDIFQIHAVPEVYRLFDYRTHELIALVDTSIAWPEVEIRELKFLSQPQPVALRVTPLATLFPICLLRPLNTNAIDDALGLLAAPTFEASGILPFVSRNPTLRPLLAEQIDRLAEISSALPADRAVAASLERLRAVLREPKAPGQGAKGGRSPCRASPG